MNLRIAFLLAFGCLPFAAALAQSDAPSQPPIDDANILARSDFQNARLRFQRERKGHVAFIGGSITQMAGYRPMVIEDLEKRFPETEFHFTHAGISSTCSTTGAFRLADHVLSEGPVDLFFIEFAVNDDQDAGHAYRESMRGMEGLVRHTRMHNPHADIVITYFVNPGMLELCRKGKTPLPMKAHEQVAVHYDVPSIHLAQQVADNISADQLTWKLFGGTHPKPFGNRIAARMIGRLFDLKWNADSGTASISKRKAYALPEPIDQGSYYRGRLIATKDAVIKHSAEIKVPDWKAIKGGKRAQFTEEPLLCMSGAASEVQLDFEGTAVGAYVLAGPDAATIQVSIDGSQFKDCDLYHRFSKGLHYPRTVMFATDLSAGKHSLTLRLGESKKPERTAARILRFVAN